VIWSGIPLDRERLSPELSGARRRPMTLFIIILFLFNVYSKLEGHFPTQ
jgi:hypothetical protein